MLDQLEERRAVPVDAERVGERQRDLAAGGVRDGRPPTRNASCAAGGSNR